MFRLFFGRLSLGIALPREASGALTLVSTASLDLVGGGTLTYFNAS